nr:hypothetical protein [Tanacetum cinerariifolium]
MVVQSELGKGSSMPTDPHHTPTILQSSSSQPQKTYKPRKPTRKVTQAATTTSSLEAEQDSGNIAKTQSKFEMRVKKLEKRNKSRTHKLKRLYKSSLTARVESSEYEESLGGDASKQGRIKAIDVDEDITLVNVQDDEDMFDVDDLGGEEVFVAEVAKDVNENVVEEDKGKGIMIGEPVKHKKKDQIRLDEEAAKRLQAKFDEEERLAKERAQKEQKANIALIET